MGNTVIYNLCIVNVVEILNSSNMSPFECTLHVHAFLFLCLRPKPLQGLAFCTLADQALLGTRLEHHSNKQRVKHFKVINHIHTFYSALFHSPFHELQKAYLHGSCLNLAGDFLWHDFRGDGSDLF